MLAALCLAASADRARARGIADGPAARLLPYRRLRGGNGLPGRRLRALKATPLARHRGLAGPEELSCPWPVPYRGRLGNRK